MNSSSKGRILLAVWSVALVLFTVTTIAAAGNKPSSPPPSKPSAPAHASAPAARPSAPAQHAGGSPGGQHSNAPTGNRGPGGNSNTNNMNRGPGGNSNANRGGGTNNMNRGPGGNTNSNNRGPGGNTNANRGNNNNANANRGNNNNANANRGGAGNANNRGQNNQGGKAGEKQAGNRPGGNQGGKPGEKQGGRPGEKQAGNRPGGGNNNHHQPNGAKTVSLKNGGKATFRKDGKVRSIQTKNMSINHGVHGERRVVAQRNGRQVVAQGRGGRVGGYSQRAYYRNGSTTYVQRTYVYGGTTYAYGYSSYYYGGYPYYGYAPSYYYGPAYYGWAYNPWPAPVYYNWGWGGAPWYGYYGAYYQPYPVYPYASLWLADFLIAASLQAAYTEQAAEAENGELVPPQFGQEVSDVIASLGSSDPLIAANLATAYGSRSYLLKAAAPAAGSGGSQMPADVKQAIADQMKKEVAAEKEAAANKGKNTTKSGEQVPAALDPNTRYFVVSTGLDVTTSDGVECGLTPGDVVYRTGDTPDEDKMVDATVKSTKKDDCALGVTVGIDTGDLQEMHNSFRQTMDQGLKKLADNAGKNGLPAAPDTKTTQGEVPAPTPDSNVNDDLQSTQKEADQAEKEAQQPN